MAAFYDPRGWNADTRNTLLGFGLQGLGGALTAKSQGKQSDKDRQSAIAQALLGSTQMDPLAQLKSQQGVALRGALLQNGPVMPFQTGAGQGGHGVGMNFPDLSGAQQYFSDDAIAGERGKFDAMVAQLAQQKQAEEQKKKGGGFMGFLKKALPFAAMAIPFVGPAIGMTAMGASALGTGLGVGGSLMNKDYSGAALNAALGGLGMARAPRPATPPPGSSPSVPARIPISPVTQRSQVRV